MVGKKKYQTELLQPALVIARYFAKARAELEALEAELATLQQQLEELAEEHAGEGGLLEDSKNDKDKLTKASAAARLQEIKGDRDGADERKVLESYLALSEQESELGAKLKSAQDALTEKVAAKYAQLSEDDVKALVVGDKWLATLRDAAPTAQRGGRDAGRAR